MLRALAFVLSPSLFAANVTGTFQYPDATLVNGSLTIALAAAAPLNTCASPVQPMQFAPRTVRITNGVLPTLALVANSCLKPNAPYNVTLTDRNHNPLFKSAWVVPASDSDITQVDSGSAVPLVAGATQATLTTTSSGLTQIVAGVGGQKIRVYAAFFLLQQTYVPTNFKLVSATGCVSNQVDLIIPQRPGIPNVGQSYIQQNYQNPLTSAPGDAVCLYLSASPISAYVQVLYTVQP